MARKPPSPGDTVERTDGFGRIQYGVVESVLAQQFTFNDGDAHYYCLFNENWKVITRARKKLSKNWRSYD